MGMCRRLAARLIALTAVCGVAASQTCVPNWVAGTGITGVDGTIETSITWDPDGTGPLGERIVVAGEFSHAGAVPANNVAAFDPVTRTWSPLGGGLDSSPSIISVIRRLCTLANGDLLACGWFAMDGFDRRVARWDGATWTPMDAGIDAGTVLEIEQLPNGELYAAGPLTLSGVAGIGLARWDGTAWQPVLDGYGRALATADNGDLIAAGDFVGLSATVASFDGTTWTPYGTGTDVAPLELLVLANGDVLAGGDFTNAGGVAAGGVARWNGSSWSAFGGSGVTGGAVFGLFEHSSGDIFVGGSFAVVDGVPRPSIARWTGSAWTFLQGDLEPRSQWATAVASSFEELPNGDVFVAGNFARANGVPVNSVAIASGSTWSVSAPAFSGAVQSLDVLTNGDVVAGGSFTWIGGVSADRVAQWDGTSWSALGVGLDGDVMDVVELPNGDVVAGGAFTGGVARWDGSSWSVLGAGLSGGAVRALAVASNGDVLAAGTFANGVARWNGVAWQSLGSGVTLIADDAVEDVVELPNGDVVVCGTFAMAGGVAVQNIASWNGSVWAPLGTGVLLGASAMSVQPNGDLVAASVIFGYVQSWNGTSWTQLIGTPLFLLSSVQDIETLSNGNLLLTSASGEVLQFDGIGWATLSEASAAVNDIDQLPNGDLIVGGAFASIDGVVSAGFARRTTCPPSATPFGSACPSSGGANLYAPDNLPVLGTIYTATGTGLPPLALVATVTTFDAPIAPVPLSLLFPEGQPGCDLLISPDIVDIGLTTTGTWQTGVAVPSTPSLAGAVLRQQLVPFELDATLAFVAITATNALTVTLGSL